jgi:prolyl oligopeptidase
MYPRSLCVASGAVTRSASAVSAIAILALAACTGAYGTSGRGATPATAPAGAVQAARIAYPQTATGDVILELHGERIPDPYRWLEEADRPEVASWVAAQNAVTRPYLETAPMREHFRARITQFYDFPRTSIPSWRGGRWWYSKNTGLQRQNAWYSRATLDGPESLVLDPNVLWPQGDVALTSFRPSPDGRYVAYGEAVGGADWRTLVVRDLATGALTADTVRWARFTGIEWTQDGRGFFYARYPEPPAGQHLSARLEHHTVYYHRLGTPQSADVAVYARPDHPSWYLSGWTDESGRWLILMSSGGTDRNTLAVRDLRDPQRPDLDGPLLTIVAEPDANYWPLSVADGRLFVQTDLDAPNRRIVAIPLDRPDRSNWITVIPEGDVPIEGSSLVAGRVGVLSLRDVASEVRLYRLDGTLEREVPMPGLGSASGLVGRFDRPELFYTYTDPLQPTTIFLYDVETGTSRPFEPPPLTFDPAHFRTDRVFYESRDGTRVPLFLPRRCGVAPGGTHPPMLYAYGGFGASETPWFAPDVIAWLEAGGIYAVANVRGGGEYGQQWHEAGRLGRKQNVFDDFIAAAEYLVREGYTSSAHLAMNGGSNGGLLVGAVMTQRPDLFAVAVPEVGVLDMLRYHEFTGGALWGVEYGLPTDPEAFRWLRAYSPLHNIRRGVCYPATLVTTADHDDRVVPAHSYKFTAALQAAQRDVAGCDRPVLLRVETMGSHGYLPLDARIARYADVWGFVAGHTGLRARPALVP